MKLKTFETEVTRLADSGVRLTVANVAARLHLPSAKTEKWLDELTKTGKLDLEIDEDHGIIVYSVRGLIPRRMPRADVHPGTELRIAQMEADLERSPTQPHALSPLGRPRRQKSVVVAFLAAAFLPGIGLFYAAPFSSALLLTIACILLMKLAVLPIVGWAIGGAVALASGVAGALYASAFNRTGERTEIVGRLTGRKQLRES